MIIHLGVVDVPYEHAGGTTTSQVANWLENKYHIMEIFAEEHRDFIESQLADAVEGQIDNLLHGRDIDEDIFAAGTSEIEDRFRKFLAMSELDAFGIPGIPTKASGRTPFRKGGINHRLKHPYAESNPSRPSFIDTSTYQLSFRCWIDA